MKSGRRERNMRREGDDRNEEKGGRTLGKEREEEVPYTLFSTVSVRWFSYVSASNFIATFDFGVHVRQSCGLSMGW